MRQTAYALISALIILFPIANAAGQGMATFTTAPAAQKHCPTDTVVWLNTSSGVYHFKGERWYGHTQRGAYVCKIEADKNGERPTRNGQ